MTGTVPARRRRAATSLVVLVLVCLATVGLGWASKARCLGDGGWQDGEQFVELCYTDAAVLWHGRGLADGKVPYLEADLEYPVLLGGLTWLLASATLAAGGGLRTFLALDAVAAAALAVAVLVLLARLGVPRRRLWWWAAAPPLALYAVWNWDLLALALLVAAIAAHRQGHATASGALAGLGAAAKLFPALLVPAVALGHVRAGRADLAARHAGGAVVAWAAVNAPVALASPDGWWHFYERSVERLPNPASTWAALDVALGGAIPGDLGAALSPVALAAGGAAILAIGARRLPPDSTWQLVVPLVAWFLLTNKVHSPQFDLWLVPLLLLVVPRLAPLAALVAVDLLVVVVELRYLGGRAGSVPALGIGWLAAAVGLRAGVLGWIVWVSLAAPLTATCAAATGRPTRRPAAPTPATAAAGRRLRRAPQR